MRIIYFTAKDAQEAKEISLALLKKRLVACCNIFPIESMYWYNNEIQGDKEFVVLAKTCDEGYDAVEKEIKGLHSYDIPAIYSWKTDRISREYEEWVAKNCKKIKKNIERKPK